MGQQRLRHHLGSARQPRHCSSAVHHRVPCVQSAIPQAVLARWLSRPLAVNLGRRVDSSSRRTHVCGKGGQYGILDRECWVEGLGAGSPAVSVRSAMSGRGCRQLRLGRHCSSHLSTAREPFQGQHRAPYHPPFCLPDRCACPTRRWRRLRQAVAPVRHVRVVSESASNAMAVLEPHVAGVVKLLHVEVEGTEGLLRLAQR
jgi:hypothetical protein